MYLTERLMRGALASGLPTNPRIVLVALASHSNQEGRCFPSQSLLRTETYLSERRISDHIKTLAALGWITIESRGKSRKFSTRYRLNIPKLLDAYSRHSVRSSRSTPDTASGQLPTQRPVTPDAASDQPDHEPENFNHAPGPDFWWDGKRCNPIDG